jgi:hypothetical protein
MVRFINKTVTLISFFALLGCAGTIDQFNYQSCSRGDRVFNGAICEQERYGYLIGIKGLSPDDARKQVEKDRVLSVKLDEPVAVKNNKVTKNMKPTINQGLSRQNEINELKAQIIANDNVKNELDNIIVFLLDSFGSPVVKDRFKIEIDDRYNTTARMALKRKTGTRIVYIKELDLYPSEQHVIVHELIHALYQPNSFIKYYPDFIIEGMAVYAQHLYRYHKKKSLDIHFKNEFKSLGCATYFDFDANFNEFSGCDLDKAYFLAGYLIATQRNPKSLFDTNKFVIDKKRYNMFDLTESGVINPVEALKLLKADYDKIFNSNRLKTVYVNNEYLNFRKLPETGDNIIRRLNAFEILRVLREKNGWLNVIDKDGNEGWVSKKEGSKDLVKYF